MIGVDLMLQKRNAHYPAKYPVMSKFFTLFTGKSGLVFYRLPTVKVVGLSNLTPWRGVAPKRIRQKNT